MVLQVYSVKVTRWGFFSHKFVTLGKKTCGVSRCYLFHHAQNTGEKKNKPQMETKVPRNHYEIRGNTSRGIRLPWQMHLKEVTKNWRPAGFAWTESRGWAAASVQTSESRSPFSSRVLKDLRPARPAMFISNLLSTPSLVSSSHQNEAVSSGVQHLFP